MKTWMKPDVKVMEVEDVLQDTGPQADGSGSS